MRAQGVLAASLPALGFESREEQRKDWVRFRRCLAASTVLVSLAFNLWGLYLLRSIRVQGEIIATQRYLQVSLNTPAVPPVPKPHPLVPKPPVPRVVVKVAREPKPVVSRRFGLLSRMPNLGHGGGHAGSSLSARLTTLPIRSFLDSPPTITDVAQAVTPKSTVVLPAVMTVPVSSIVVPAEVDAPSANVDSRAAAPAPAMLATAALTNASGPAVVTMVALGGKAPGSGTGAAPGTGSGFGVGGNGLGSGTGVGAGSGRGGVFGNGGGGGGPCHIVYLLDVSYSMVSRMDRARSEVIGAIESLRPQQDTFDIIAFGGPTVLLDKGMLPVTPDSIKAATAFLNGLTLLPYTNIENAIKTALDRPGVNVVELITDGQPTAGEINWGKLERKIHNANREKTPIFTVGLVGRSEDGQDQTFEARSLLQHIASDSGGMSRIAIVGSVYPEGGLDSAPDFTAATVMVAANTAQGTLQGTALTTSAATNSGQNGTAPPSTQAVPDSVDAVGTGHAATPKALSSTAQPLLVTPMRSKNPGIQEPRVAPATAVASGSAPAAAQAAPPTGSKNTAVEVVKKQAIGRVEGSILSRILHF